MASGVHFDNDAQEAVFNFKNLLELLEKHRRSQCNLKLCCNILYSLLKAFRKTGACLDQANVLKLLGHSLISKSSYEESITVAEQLVIISNELGNERMKIDAYYILIKNYVLKGSLEFARNNLEECLQFSKASEDDHCIGYAAMASSLVLFWEQKYDEAIKKAVAFIAIAQRLGDRDGECEAILHLGTIHSILFNMQESLDLYSKGLEIAERLHYTELVMKIKVDQARTLAVLGNHERAYKVLQDLNPKLDSYDDKSLVFKATCNLSVIALILNRDKDALEFAFKTLAIAKLLNASEPMALGHGNIGLALEKLKDYSGAIDNFQNCLKYGKKLKSGRIINQSYCTLGRVYEAKGEKKTARKYYEKALTMPKPPSIHWGDTENFRFSPHFLLAKLDIEENNMAKAEEHLKRVVERCKLFRKNVKDSLLKICFNDTQSKPYQYLQHVLLARDAREEALLVGETGRGRDFYDKVTAQDGKGSVSLDTVQDILKFVKRNNLAVLFLSQLEV